MSEKRMTVKEVATELEMSIGTVRAGLRTKAFDFRGSDTTRKGWRKLAIPNI